ncbi:CynX/NimT family MFS transporter [Variovorax sp. OV329]|uniref:MFS transporter n=1 Tax=Variovorax sp. OV329 TaxID=1882825 RepID=UPI0008E85E81|nr:MFS transporter [Variovorax sp. OV329]SFM19278.1 Cyanate permease [Variovorax sp. OV329]
MAAYAVVAAGVSAALHLGKLAPAVPALRDALGIGLVEAGFLLSLVQVAGMTLGLAVGLIADSLGLRRSMLGGLMLLTLAGFAGGLVQPGPQALTWLLLFRALEGMGFLLAVMPGPGLIRNLASPAAEKSAMGLWGAYMPVGVAAALLVGPPLIARSGWPGWWWLISAISAVAAVGVLLAVRPDARKATGAAAAPAWQGRLSLTLKKPGPRLLGLAFAVYAAQWMAVIGFLPAIYADAGVAATWTGVLSSVAAATNIVGNIAGGRFLQAGVAPGRLMRWGYGVMLLGSVGAFAQWGHGADAWALPSGLRYACVCLFSLGGGMVPATLFMLAVRLAPSSSTVSTTVGLMQQASSLGQFFAPPAVAWLAMRAGGWQWTWVATMACSVVGMAAAAKLARLNSARLAENTP